MSIGNIEIGDFHQITTSANVMPSDGGVIGIFVSAASSTPTITVYDSATNTTTIKVVDTFTPVAATWYYMPVAIRNGCYVATGGTVSCTVVTAP